MVPNLTVGMTGGNMRVGLADKLWRDTGQMGPDDQLVKRAVGNVGAMGARVIGPDAVGRETRAPGV